MGDKLKPINQLSNEILTKFRNYYAITGTKSTESLPEILTWLDVELMSLYENISRPTQNMDEVLSEFQKKFFWKDDEGYLPINSLETLGMMKSFLRKHCQPKEPLKIMRYGTTVVSNKPKEK